MKYHNVRLFSKRLSALPNHCVIKTAFVVLLTINASFAAAPIANLGSSSAIIPNSTSSSSTQPISAVGTTNTITLPAIGGTSVLPGQTPTTTQTNLSLPVTTVAPMPVQPQTFDYSANLKSDVFGTQLFTGRFAQQGTTQFNPDYTVAIGDQIQVRLWGGYVFESLLTVDPQGNVFLPQVGPVKVLGVHNQDLQNRIETAVRRVFRANVFSYASLASAHPVRIFVGGFVNRPGLYYGTSMDSLLHYVDQAGGIDPGRGSFLNVQVKRGTQLRAALNLYDFLFEGRIPLIQLADGDVVFVSARQNTALVSGAVKNPKRFEFQSSTMTIAKLSRLAKPSSSVTHVRITRNLGVIKNIDYYPIAQANEITVGNGDAVEYTADKKPGTITVRVEGEHQSPQEYVLPYGSRMGDLLRQIKFSERSDTASIQLYRESMRTRQKDALDASLKKLEASVLTARIGTSEEAALRSEEAARVLQWVQRAKSIVPTGQVLIAQAENRDDLLLENTDRITIPPRDGLVLVGGEVLFPNSIAYDSSLSINDYVNLAGGYNQSADESNTLVLHRDGHIDDSATVAELRAGDSIMVMPKVDDKSFVVGKELIQMLFQIGIAASVLLLL